PAFDAAFYLTHNPDVAKAGADPHLHFHRYGWREFRNPAGHFDTWWYSSAYLPQSAGAVDPLVHYLLLGERLGFCPVPPNRPVGPGLRPEQSDAARVCLFAAYDPDGLVDDSVLRYVRELSRHADVYYLADCTMAPGELDKLEPYVKGAWAERHGAYDFGSWSRLARDLVGWGTIERYDELLLVNDSCYLLRSLDDVLARMSATACDWWGLQATQRSFVSLADGAALPTVDSLVNVESSVLPRTRHLDALHVSSYFVAYRRPVIEDVGFRRLMDGVQAEADKSRIILKYEIGISR